ncbi:MAG: DNA-processing protein DprA [Candidatus Eiseniibacteriota bacterium]|jgi:DNA processing protein
MPDALDRIAATIVAQETRGLGERRWRRCLEACPGDPVAALGAAGAAGVASAARSAWRRWQRPSVREEARRRARRFLAAGGRLLLAGEPGFPPRLAAVPWMPVALYLQGAAPLPGHAATLVGTRRATPSACDITRRLAAAIARAGVSVVSGLALGIDAAAHRGALEAGGPTVAVLGTGTDRCYPRQHRQLRDRIAAGGLLISQLPPGTGPRAYQFPARNRILAALADVVVVVQAPAASGALITARQALELGVEVMAVPGDPCLPENAGSNRLIADGAAPVLDASDLLGAVFGMAWPVPAAAEPAKLPAMLGGHARRLLAAIDLTPRSLEATAAAIGLRIADVLEAAIELELAGLAESLPGGHLRLTPRGARSARRPGDGCAGRPPGERESEAWDGSGT